MPTIHRINAIIISMNNSDHNPPHLHVAHPDFAVLLDIRNGEIIRGQARTSQLREVREWMAANREMLLDKWEKREGWKWPKRYTE